MKNSSTVRHSVYGCGNSFACSHDIYYVPCCNAAIKASSTYEEFLLLMRAKGYEIKGEAFGEDAPKFISFRPLGKDRFVRGSVKSLGREYTKERIKERIELKRERKAVIPKRDYADKDARLFQHTPCAAIENDLALMLAEICVRIF